MTTTTTTWDRLQESWPARSTKRHPEPNEAVHSAIYEIYLLKAEELLAKWTTEQATVLDYNLKSFRKSQYFDVPTEEVTAICNQLEKDFNLREGYMTEIISEEWLARRNMWKDYHATSQI